MVKAVSIDYLLVDENFSNVFLIYNEALFVKRKSNLWALFQRRT